MSGHVLTVERVEDVTPRMRRVHFGGPGVAGYVNAGAHLPNVKLYFPVPGQPLDLPERGERGWVWKPGQRERVRTYTVRSLADDASTMSVDFVRHSGTSVAASWAESAAPGDQIAALAGGGVVVGEADWVLLAGDETALPAIAGTLERFGPQQRGLALIEVAGPEEEQDLAAPQGVELRWLHRRGAAPGTTTLLSDALAAVEFPAAELAAGQVEVWVSAESAVVRFARSHLKERAFPRRQQLIIGYWNRGIDEVTYGRATDHDRVDGELDTVLPGQAEPRRHHAPANGH
ncbi:siderophore-interacting protein [Arthrobacter caoxuetaonis]|uniref:siderophore-interacting protein n=1 Tax=Arthrobacter caoxuetaonis TaxID=2886935 RepID=UPI001D141894|nr:siderophore-interacting protein [Arthrobacter caoxuetaonis]MCC3282869.1 siderophore-interacting protein [Arthrobacter caoxuetaonis]